MKKGLLILGVFLLGGINTAFAQINEVGKFFAAGVEDAEKLINPYLAPYFNAFGASLTGGWYNTAKVHKLGGFDLTATFNTAIVPSSDKSYDLNTIEFESLKLAPGESGITPTIAGDNSTGSQLNYNINNPLVPETKAFDMPKGTGWAYVPSPMLQLGVGLVKETEIIGRYMPTYHRSGSEVGMWGVGVKHGLKQWIPFIKKVPVLDLTLHYGYTKMNAHVAMDVTPGDIYALDMTTQSVTWDNQSMDFVTQSHTGNLIISATLPIVSFYGGIGFATTKTDFKLLGYYPSVSPEGTVTGTFYVDDASALLDPVKTTFKNSDGKGTKPRLNAGVRFKFAIVTLHFDYTYANYSMATAGLGFTFR